MSSKRPTIDVQLNATALVAIYNSLAEHPVKKFSDKPTALKRVEAILDKHDKRVVAHETEGYEVVPTKVRTKKPRVRSQRSRRRITEPKFEEFLAAVAADLRGREAATTGAAAQALGEVAQVFENYKLFPGTVVES